MLFGGSVLRAGLPSFPLGMLPGMNLVNRFQLRFFGGLPVPVVFALRNPACPFPGMLFGHIMYLARGLIWIGLAGVKLITAVMVPKGL